MNSNKLALGSVQFGLNYGIGNLSGQTSPKEVGEILKLAYENSIQVIDTAYLYGQSEEVLGEFELGSFKVVSKFPSVQKVEDLNFFFNASLKRLGVKKLYGYLAHRPFDLIKNPNLWHELKTLKKSGFIDKIGYSLYTPAELESLLSVGFFPDIIQVPFSIFDRRFETALISLHSQGVEIHTRSTFLQGLFFYKPEDLPVFFDEARFALSELDRQIPQLKDKASFLLKFSIDQAYIDKVVIGVNTSMQLKENLEGITKANNIKLDIDYYHFSESILLPSNWPKI